MHEGRSRLGPAQLRPTPQSTRFAARRVVRRGPRDRARPHLPLGRPLHLAAPALRGPAQPYRARHPSDAGRRGAFPRRGAPRIAARCRRGLTWLRLHHSAQAASRRGVSATHRPAAADDRGTLRPAGLESGGLPDAQAGRPPGRDQRGPPCCRLVARRDQWRSSAASAC